jgi:adenosylcobinamide-phosphate synthase
MTRSHLYALLLGFIIDLLAGDPPRLPHPVRLIGGLIVACEKRLRAVFPKSPQGELWAGAVMAATVAGASLGSVLLLLWLCGLVSPLARLASETLLCWQLLAVKSLRTESMKVHAALSEGDIVKARRAVSMIVAGMPSPGRGRSGERRR